MVIVNKRIRFIELVVGLFIILGAIALIALAFKVSGLTSLTHAHYYTVYAEFDNVGDLRIRAPVRMAGVTIGEVGDIWLDPDTFRAKVTLLIDKVNDRIPTDSGASIFTEGILGSNYISITPGYDNTYLKNGSLLVNTHPALILENLIGQLIFNAKDKK